MELKTLFGIFLFFFSLTAIILNLIIFKPVFRLAFITKYSSVYIIAFFNIIVDLFQLLGTCFHLAPSIILESYLISDKARIFIGGFTVQNWYMGSYIQVMMAVNRLTIITFNRNNIFTYWRTLLIFIFLEVVSIVNAVLTQFILPCCLIVPDHTLLTSIFVLKDDVFNYSDSIVTTTELVCAAISIICYTCVFISIRNISSSTLATISSSKNIRDRKYLLQFFLISLFYISAFVLFEAFVHIGPMGNVMWYGLLPLSLVMNNSANALVYMMTNREVRKHLSIPWMNKRIGGLAGTG